MNNQEQYTSHEDTELIEQLRKLPVQPVPEHLKAEIMCRIDRLNRPKPFMCRIRNIRERMNQPFTFSVRPIYVFSMIVLLTGSFWLGRVTVEVPYPPTGPVMNPESQLFTQTTNAESAYLLGRGLLAAQKEEQGLNMLHRAALLEPDNPEFAYWEGVGYWLNDNTEQERQSYLRGLSAAPETVPILVNLGHNYLAEGNYTQALETYEHVLTISPTEHDALYNQGLIFRKQGRTDDEIRIWKRFLAHYRTGKTAFRAVDRLNSHGDFSYRAYLVGARKVIVSQNNILSSQTSTEEQFRELLPIVSMLEAHHDLRLELVVFIYGDLAAAHNKAVSLKQMISSRAGANIADRVAISWLDSCEKVQTRTTKEYQLDRSLLIFTAVSTSVHNKEVSI